MNVTKLIKSLGPIDLRNVGRDGLLPWMVALPVITALIIRWGVPPIANAVLDRYGFDLVPYYPVILGYFFILMTPMTFGALIGFLLLDERDDDTLTALQVTPLTLNSYLAYRIAVPMALSVLLMFVIFPLANLANLDFVPLLIAALSAAPLAPLFALYLGAFAENKVQGFALMKGIGSVGLAPVFAFFIQSPWQLAFGIVPAYWPVKVYWTLSAGDSNVWVYLVIGLVYQMILIALLLRRFNRVMHR